MVLSAPCVISPASQYSSGSNKQVDDRSASVMTHNFAPLLVVVYLVPVPGDVPPEELAGKLLGVLQRLQGTGRGDDLPQGESRLAQSRFLHE